MERVEGDQEEHPYVVGLKSGIEEKLSEFMCKELCVSVECCECVKDHCGRKICQHQGFGCSFTFLFD